MAQTIIDSVSEKRHPAVLADPGTLVLPVRTEPLSLPLRRRSTDDEHDHAAGNQEVGRGGQIFGRHSRLINR